MNEEKMNQAMVSYRESLGTCSKQPVKAPARRSRIGFALATAGVIAFALAIALWPKDAVAESLKRVGLAIKNARTMEVRSLMETSSGKWHEFSHAFYRDGAWRYQTRKGSGLASTIVVKDGQALTEYDRLDHATLEKADPTFLSMMESEMSALDFAKRGIDQGQVGIERKMSIEKGDRVNGVPTYRIVFERAEDSYRAEIVVDQDTDLPISTATTLHHGNDTQPRLYREEYRFNHRLSDSLFSLVSSRRTIRLADEQAKLIKAWEKPLAKAGQTVIRDASVTQDGTIWVACTMPDSQEGQLPIRLKTRDGQPYGRSLDINPSAILGKQGTFTFRGDDVVIIGFFPLDINQPKPTDVQVVFGNREAHYPGHSKPDGDGKSEGLTLSIPVKILKEQDRPSYFPALDLDHFGFQLPITIWNSRAEDLQKAGRLLEAAKAFEQTAVEYRNFVKYAGYKPLIEAAKIYRELGMTDTADARQSEANSLKAGRQR